MDPFSECGSCNQGGQGGGDGQRPRPEGCLSHWTHRSPAKVSPCSGSRRSHPHHARLPEQRRNRTAGADAQGRDWLPPPENRSGAGLLAPCAPQDGPRPRARGTCGPTRGTGAAAQPPRPALPGLALLGSRAASAQGRARGCTAEAQGVSWHRARAWRPEDPSPQASREWSGSGAGAVRAGGRDGISFPGASSLCSHRTTREGMQGPATGDADPGDARPRPHRLLPLRSRGERRRCV